MNSARPQPTVDPDDHPGSQLYLWGPYAPDVIPEHGATYDAEAVFSPTEMVDEDTPSLPSAVVLGFDDALHGLVTETGDLVGSDRQGDLEYRLLSQQVAFVPVQELGVGAPAAAIATEKAIASGVAVVVVLTSAGSLQPAIPPDAALLPTRAVRDEGASYHYLPPDEQATATEGLVDDLGTALVDAGVETHRGPVWTTSALFRETVPQVERYRDEGFVSVDMESAAVWAVARFRGVDAATVHAVGSSVSAGRTGADDSAEITESPSDAEPNERLSALLGPTVRALESYGAEQR